MNRNKDGAGIAFVKDGKIVIDKGYFNFDTLYKAIKEVEDQEILVHFRISTHGGISMENCHPFLIESKTHPQITFAVCHNGQLPWRSTKTQSDTACFVEDMLTPILNQNPWAFDGPEGRHLLASFIGIRNKITILRHDAADNRTDTIIVNHKEGNNAHGAWFSNHSYIAYTPVVHHNEYDWRNETEWVDVKETIMGVETTIRRLKPKANVTQTELPKLDSVTSVNPDARNFEQKYLDKKDRKRFTKLAADFNKKYYGEYQGFSINNCIMWLRSDVRCNVPGMEEMTTEDLDKWIVKQIGDYPGITIPPTISQFMIDVVSTK